MLSNIWKLDYMVGSMVLEGLHPLNNKVSSRRDKYYVLPQKVNTGIKISKTIRSNIRHA